ncbi:hypothetical protein GCM10010343_17760 [Streptomyces avidinii]|uniref:Transposase IS4-like domain-containing protein n=1 Tax=Streptomyces avidinii TaxID=1895 RepID=A0ABS4L3Z0_STRAV|nr:hypothetical protein [Streptomyces avidinii]GGY93054.1 hypothetical protein GCM10010343_17760 [Streptomyces avidinii]
MILTAGQVADSPQVIPVLKKVRVRGPVGRPRTRPGAVAGDKAYSSRGNRAYLRKRHIKAVIPEKKDQAANRVESTQRGGCGLIPNLARVWPGTAGQGWDTGGRNWEEQYISSAAVDGAL